MELRYDVITLMIGIIVSSGCLDSESEKAATIITEPSTSTIKASPISTSTTTILPATTTTSTIVTTSSIAPIVVEISCDSICGESGYGGGYCRRNVMECRLNSENYNRAGSRYCPRIKHNTCCCFNEEDRGHKNATTHYVYNVGK